MKNRWLVALCAVGIHISIGSIYAWSQIAVSLKHEVHTAWSLSQITLTFSIAILFLGLAAAFMGNFVEKKGPRISGMLAALLFGLGLIGASIAIKNETLWLLYVTYGALGGIGIGLGYVTPVSTLLKWFPDHRGLAMGITIMGFGFGAAGEVFLLQNFLPWLGSVSVSTNLLIIGCIYFALMFLSSLYLAPPPEDWLPKNFRGKNTTAFGKNLVQLTANEAIKTPRFYYLWIMLFINVTCGIALISVAKFMGKEVIHLTSQMAAVMVILMSVFNGCGRIAWATLSDYITRPITYILFYLLQIACFVLLIKTKNPMFFQILVFVILTCYGGGFSVAPAFIGDIFGTKEAGKIHGYILTAWAAAGLIGPTIIAWVRDATGGYVTSLYIFVGFLVIAFIVSLLMAANVKKLLG